MACQEKRFVRRVLLDKVRACDPRDAGSHPLGATAGVAENRTLNGRNSRS